MKLFKVSVLFMAILSTFGIILTGCGGGGGGGGGSSSDSGLNYVGKTTAAEISIENTSSVLASFSDSVPVCSSTGVTAKAVAKKDQRQQVVIMALRKLIILPAIKATKQLGKQAQLTGTPPADMLGDCGGKITFKNYSHSNGDTTATLSFVNYCSEDATTGEITTINGDIPFVDDGTPSDSGPITTSLKASSPLLTQTTKSASGETLSASSLAFSNFLYTPGNPGEEPTDAKPDKYELTSLVAKNDLNSKNIRVENLVLTQSNTASGGDKVTLVARIYSGGHGYVNVSTSGNPIITDPDGNLVSGALILTGADNKTVTLTVVPGAAPAFKVAVNGTLMEGVTLSCNIDELDDSL